MAGILDKFGASPGALVTTVVIAPVLVPAGQRHQISELDCTMATGGTNMVVSIQASNDNFALNIVERARTEMPNAGSFLKTFDSPVTIPSGLRWRVVMVQGVGAAMSVRVAGQTFQNSDDLPGDDAVDIL